MIRINGEIGFTLGFEIEHEITEEQWMQLNEREQAEIIMEYLDRNDYNNMEADGVDTYDIEEVEEEGEK